MLTHHELAARSVAHAYLILQDCHRLAAILNLYWQHTFLHAHYQPAGDVNIGFDIACCPCLSMFSMNICLANNMFIVFVVIILIYCYCFLDLGCCLLLLLETWVDAAVLPTHEHLLHISDPLFRNHKF